MSDNLIVGAISFAAALIAVVLGQLLAGRVQAVQEERRWKREDNARRRIRSEEMAREAIDRLGVVTEFVGWRGGYERGEAAGNTGTWLPPNASEVSALLRPVRRAALEIDEPAIRDHLETATEVLVNGHAAEHYGAPHPARTAYAVQRTSEAIVGAYLRGSSLPTSATPDPDLDSHWRALNSAADGVATLYEMYQEDEDQ